MSPTAEQLETRIGRELQQGDILVRQHRTSTTTDGIVYTYYEVEKPEVKGIVGFIIKKSITGVEVHEITPFGRTYDTSVFEKNENIWSGVVRKEDRTDLSQS